MQGNDKVIAHLNKILYNELRAINQYFLHSRMLSDWGLDKFAEYEYSESMDEMQHADKLIQRILFLEGLPNLQDLGALYIAEEPVEVLSNDLKLEHEAILISRKRSNIARALKILSRETYCKRF